MITTDIPWWTLIPMSIGVLGLYLMYRKDKENK